MIPSTHSRATDSPASPLSPPHGRRSPARCCLPQDLVPGLLQPVNGVALQSREDGSEGGEVLQDAALLGADKETTGLSAKESPDLLGFSHCKTSALCRGGR